MKAIRDHVYAITRLRVRKGVAQAIDDLLENPPPCYAKRTSAEWKSEVERLQPIVEECFIAYDSHADKRTAVTERRKWEAYYAKLVVATAYEKHT